jgi:hypothetical protein
VKFLDREMHYIFHYWELEEVIPSESRYTILVLLISVPLAIIIVFAFLMHEDDEEEEH